jgi:hypothetical protein
MDEKLYLDEEAREDYQRHLMLLEASEMNYQDDRDNSPLPFYDHDEEMERAKERVLKRLSPDSDATGYTEERGPGRIENLPQLPKGGTDGFHYAEGAGIVGPIDVEAETVRPIDCSCDNGLYESLTGDWAVCQKCRPSRVGPTPTSPEAETTPWNHQTLEDEAMAAMLAAEKQTLLDCLSTIEQVLNKQSPDVGAALDGCYQIYKHLRGL